MTEDTKGPEKGQAFGAAALTQVLSGIDFPTSKDKLISEYGDTTIEVEKGKEMTVREVVENCHDHQFETMADVLACEQVQNKLKAA